MKKNIRVALSFATFTHDHLNSFLILLLVCLKNNPLFPDLPVAYADLQALVATFQAKYAAAKTGGTKDTAALNEAVDAVVATLRPGQLCVNLYAVSNARAYHVQYCIGSAPWTDLGIFPNTRNIVIPGTVAGTTYSSRIQAIGGSTQYSPWSAVVSLMST